MAKHLSLKEQFKQSDQRAELDRKTKLDWGYSEEYIQGQDWTTREEIKRAKKIAREILIKRTQKSLFKYSWIQKDSELSRIYDNKGVQKREDLKKFLNFQVIGFCALGQGIVDFIPPTVKMFVVFFVLYLFTDNFAFLD